MHEVRNLGKKRVFDLSDDKKMAVIAIGGHITKITANDDGTLLVKHECTVKDLQAA